MTDKKIDQRLKEIEEEVVLLSNYLSEAVEKKLGIQIKTVKESLDKLQKSGVGISKAEGVAPDITDDLSRLQSDITDLIRTIGSDEYKTKDDNLTRRIENASGVIMKRMTSLDTNIQNTVKNTTDKQLELKKTIIENLDTLRATSEAVQHVCTIDEKRTLGNEIALISNRIEQLSGDIPNIPRTITEKLTYLEKNIHDTDAKNTTQYNDLKKTLLTNLDELLSTTELIQQLCTMDEEKRLGSEIALISDRLENLSQELPHTSETILQDLSSLNTNIDDKAQHSAEKQDEMKDILLREIKSVHENAEIIRRMCTTDEEKYIGSMSTVVYNKVQELSEEIPAITDNIQKWFLTIDKHLRTVAKQTMTKQEEVKKIILYDIQKLGNIAETLQKWCTTEEDRTLGSEMIMVSNRVEKMSEEMPDILEIVSALSGKLDKVSSEVMRMRWFVIGAVAISIIVLVVSFLY